MSDLLSAQEEKLNIEAFGELPGPRGIIVSSLCGSTNQRFAVICKGDFPFPFQTSDQTAMNGIMIKCHTHKCTRVVTLKNFTEGQILERTDALGKCYL